MKNRHHTTLAYSRTGIYRTNRNYKCWGMYIEGVKKADKHFIEIANRNYKWVLKYRGDREKLITTLVTLALY